jgi:hypothetical protein
VKKLAVATALVLLAVPCAADPSPRAQAVTRLDDARSCAPLAGGGFAVATGGGLAILDEHGAAKTVTAIDGLPDTRVHSVVEQGDGVWVGTEAGAAFVTRGGHVARTAGTAPVQSVYIANNGAIYLGTRGAGVFRLASREAAPELLRNGTKGTRVSAIAEKDGAIYVAYADGPLARLDGNALVGLEGAPTHGQSLGVARGTLFYGDLEGLYRVEGTTFTQVASVDARGIAPGGDGILVATFGGGLQTGSVRGALRTDPVVPKLARGVGSRGAARCVATTEGVFVDDGSSGLHKVALGGPSSNDVTALVASPSGKIAIGTFENGAQLREGEAWKRVPGTDPHDTIEGMAWQGDRLWVATAHGLVRVSPDGSSRRFTSHDGLPSSFSRAVAVVTPERVLVGTDSGPALVEGDRVIPIEETKKGAPRGLASPMHAAYAVAAAPDGTLYIGTTAGLYWGKDGTFTRAALATGELQDDWVTAIALDGSDLFVGTYAKGVTHLRFENGKPKATHLGGGYVNDDGITIVNGNVYASTMEHVLVRPKGDDAAHWQPLPSATPGRDVTAVRFAAGAMWVASRRGIGVTRL